MAEQPPRFLDGLANNASGVSLRAAYHALQAGVFDGGDLLVTAGPGTREVLVAAGRAVAPSTAAGVAYPGKYELINDGQVSSTAFAAVAAAGSQPAAPGAIPAAGTNPRLDQIIGRVWDHAVDGSNLRQWRLAVAVGTETAGVTLANRSGAVADASLPPNWVRLADVITRPGMTAYPAADIRDRRPWARGVLWRQAQTDFNASVAQATQTNYGAAVRLECSGAPLTVTVDCYIGASVAGAMVSLGLLMDGAQVVAVPGHAIRVVDNTVNYQATMVRTLLPAAGSHLFQVTAQVNTAATLVLSDGLLSMLERPGQPANNGTA